MMVLPTPRLTALFFLLPLLLLIAAVAVTSAAVEQQSLQSSALVRQKTKTSLFFPLYLSISLSYSLALYRYICLY